MTKKNLEVRMLRGRRTYRLPLVKVAGFVMANAPLDQASKQPGLESNIG